MQVNFKKIAIFIIISFLASGFISLIILFFLNPYSDPQNIDNLLKKEKHISNRYGRGGDEIEICFYPPDSVKGAIVREDLGGDARYLSLYFIDNGKKRYGGIHLNLTVNLEPYLDTGNLEFRAKTGNVSGFKGDISIILKENRNMAENKTARFESGTILDNQWRQFSIKLSDFFFIEGNSGKLKNSGYTAQINQVLFSFSANRNFFPLHIYIDGIKVQDKGKIIYDLL